MIVPFLNLKAQDDAIAQEVEQSVMEVPDRCAEQAGSYPVAEQSAAELVSLPMFPELSEEQIAYVCRELKYLSAAPVVAK